MLIADTLARSLSAHADRTALRFEDRSWTYRELEQDTRVLAEGLSQLGVKKGDRVAFLLPNSPEIVLVSLACWRLAAIAVPLNPRLKAGELSYILQHSESTLCLVASALYACLEPLRADLAGVGAFVIVGDSGAGGTVPFAQLMNASPSGKTRAEVTADDAAAILYTSGSTARPKGATHTQRSLGAAACNFAQAVDLRESDSVLGMLALCHVFGFTLQILAPLCVGATAVIVPDFAPERVLELIGRHEVTHLYGLPLMFESLVRHPRARAETCKSLRCCLAGGDQVTADLSERVRSILGVELYEGCGMTEVLPYALNRPALQNRVGSIGKPSVGMELRVVDTEGQDVPPGAAGEILVRSEALMDGYWNDPDTNRQVIVDGWFHTGDVGRCDEDGYYWFVGRSKDIIKRGGSKISPAEVEDVLSLHPSVQDVAVVGKPDVQLGERVAAFVVFKPSMTATAEDLQTFAAERIAKYKVPEIFAIVTEFPRGSTGKVQRNLLKQMLNEGTTEIRELPVQ